MVSPNPVTDYLTIKSEIEIDKIEIYSLLGECVIVEQASLPVPNNVQKIDVNSLNIGVYFLRIGNETRMFVKE